MTEKKRNHLAEKINDVFSGVKHPREMVGDLEELKHFVNKSWTDLTLVEINATEGLVFFSHSGLQYFLPAYLIAILKHPDTVSKTLQASVLRDLSEFDTVWGTTSGKLCEIFTVQQKQVILEFLEQYDALLPMIPELDLNSMNDSDREIFEIRKAKRDHLIKQAIEYWGVAKSKQM